MPKRFIKSGIDLYLDLLAHHEVIMMKCADVSGTT